MSCRWVLSCANGWSIARRCWFAGRNSGWRRSKSVSEILGGFLIAYLNLDEVIRIIREEDEPKQGLMRVFELTDVQAESILNMRLRSLRKLARIRDPQGVR